MATAGSRDKNLFKPGGKLQGTTYYLLVDTDGVNKGRITVKTKQTQGNITGTSGDRTVGFIPLDNTFQPSTTTNPEEIEYFSSANGQKAVKNQGVITTQKSGISEQQARQLIFPNTATPPGTPPPAQDPSEDSQREEEKVNLEPQSISVSIPEKVSEKSDANLKVNLRYPENMNDSQDNIIFAVKKLVGRKNINELTAGADFSLGENKYSNVLGTVVLPVQPSITDSNGVEWGGSTLNPIQAYAASKSMSMIDAPGGDITAAAGRALNEAAKDFKTGLTDAGYKKAISLYFAQEAVGAQNLLSRTSGTILNPNLELLFNGPTLRPFNFTFRLSPRSESEAVIVKQIIKFFKTAMAVRRAKSEVFLKAPCIFNISYLTGIGLHQSLNQIKECALIGCDVDYTPDGTYMTFNDKDKTMTSYQLTLRFSELTPIYNTDYEDGHPIGY